jgi:hypothetical protein
MSSAEELEIAEARMNNARQALLDYVSQRISLDRDQYRRLVARVKNTQVAFLRASSELGNGDAE